MNKICIGEDWPWQDEAYQFAIDKPAAMLAMDMGTGKSRVAVNLVVNRRAMTTLIVCPKKVCGVWRREFEMHGPPGIAVFVPEKGTGKQKTQSSKDFRQMCFEKNQPCVIVLNYEIARARDFKAWSSRLIWDYVILDESHKSKAPHSVTGKYTGAMFTQSKYRLCLTGTPMPHSPLDIFAQYRFLMPQIYGWSYVKFRARYAKCHEQFKSLVLFWKNQEEMREKFASIAFRVGSEVLDLPDAKHVRREVEMSPRAFDIYKDIEHTLRAEVGNGLVTASNGLVKLVRLQQLTSGVIQKDRSEVLTRIDNEKSTALNTLLMDTIPSGVPVVVFCRFTADLDAIRSVANGWGKKYGEISGRQCDLTEHSTMPEDIDIMGVQIQSGGTGIDLTRSAHVVYFSMGWSMGDYLQSLARVHRPGQENDVTYYHLVCKGTIDEAVYAALAKRENLVESVLSSLERGEEDE